MNKYCSEHSGVEERLDANDRRIDELTGKLNKIGAWVMGIAGGIILSLILLVINLGLSLKGK